MVSESRIRELAQRELTRHILEARENIKQWSGELQNLQGDNVPDFNDVWGGAGPDNH